MSDPERWAKMKPIYILASLLFLCAQAAQAADFITHVGTYASEHQRIKLVIEAKPDMKIRFRVYFLDLKGGTSDTGPSDSVLVSNGRWGFYIENEDRVWFYDGLTTITYYEAYATGTGRKMPPDVEAWYQKKLGK